MDRLNPPTLEARRARGWLIACAIAVVLQSGLGTALASSLELVVDLNENTVHLLNPTVVSEVFDGYTISSSTDELQFIDWMSIADNYDATGDQSVDSSAEWFVISADSSSLTEVSPMAFSGALAPGASVLLGELWSGLTEDLSATVSSGASTMAIGVDYRDLTADYDGNLVIDLNDFAVFTSTFGSISDLRADGNNDGVVDAADYTVWRDSSELSLVAPIDDLSAQSALPPQVTSLLSIPEPLSVILMIGLLITLPRRCSRQG